MMDNQQRLGAAPYVIAGFSFFPLLGVPFGIAAILWGLLTKKKGRGLLVVLGAGGILVTIGLYGGLYYKGFVERGGIADDLKKRLALQTLDNLVSTVELYRLQHGSYPSSLDELQKAVPKGNAVFINDPFQLGASKDQEPFYYQRVESDHYYLRSIGPDGMPFTADDIVPDVTNPSGRLGLLIDKSQ
ncbi:type II secretion system protein GspG [Rhizobium sp. IMFF44]|uniref:type II secretion system protein GspG n=1 Tax=unclassified Rhizobium TaxID=2613769 RepID=UPI0035B90B09